MDMYVIYLTVVYGTLFLTLCPTTDGQKDRSPVSNLIFRSSYGNSSFVAGNEAVFVCIAHGGVPQPKIKWYIDTEPVKNASQNLYFGVSSVRGTLDVVMYREMDKRPLVCEAHNGVGDPVTVSTTLTVRYPPYVTVRYNSKKKMVVCEAQGNPRIFTFLHWHRTVGNETLPVTSSTKLSDVSWGLPLPEGNLQDTGYYTCSVSNQIGKGSGQKLICPWGPPVFIDTTSNYTAYLESNITISFDFYSSPDVVKYEWRRHGTAFADWDIDTEFTDTNVTLSLRDNSIHVPGRTVSVQLTNVTLDMAGNYSLFLYTKIGQYSKQDFTLLILEEVSWGPPTSTPGPIMLESGPRTGIIVLIIVIIVNVIVCVGIIFWRSRRISKRNANAKIQEGSRERTKFLPGVPDNGSAFPPTPPRRTTSAGRVRPQAAHLGVKGHYAELDFGHIKNKNKGNSVIRKDPPTEYAWIDFSRPSCSPEAS
ncbi:hemicentin-1-like [Liolophura sinensis]|uniref:hemicentin-1-like n=1 Tax=Liolophura sinensis TaxID=3198878 RepID=UPI0031596D8A